MNLDKRVKFNYKKFKFWRLEYGKDYMKKNKSKSILNRFCRRFLKMKGIDDD